MASDSDHATGKGPIRRRSLGNTDTTDEYAPDPHASATTTAPQTTHTHTLPGRSAGSGQDTTSASSGTDLAPPRYSSQDAHAPARTVRFSEDLQRSLPAQRSASDAGLRPEETGRHHQRNLSLNLGWPSQKAFGVGPRTPVSPAQVSPSPLSPSHKTRGHSLRRTLFNRSMPADGASDGTIIELQEGASSSSGSPHSSSTARTVVGKKGASETTISVSPIHDKMFDDKPKVMRYEKKGPAHLPALPNYQYWLERQRNGSAIAKVKETYKKVKKIVLRIQEIPPTKDGRHIPLDASRKDLLVDERTNRPYVDNFIKSSKYTVWNFVPVQLVAQFSKLANFYFLTISILQMIPGLSTTGTFTTIAPLLVFVGIAMGKEGYDDYRRHKMDKEENNLDVEVLCSDGISVGTPNWTMKKWHDLRVGDIVKIKRDEAAPADLVVLHSSGENNVAYVETMALDGETNLKSKQVPTPLAKICPTQNDIANARAELVAEDPNVDLYKFDGRIAVGTGEAFPLTNNEVMYRNSILRNTPEALGLVVYSGEECKIRMNANRNFRIKAPRLQSIVNRIVVIIVCFVIALALFNTIAYQIWKRYERKAYYLKNARVPFHQIFISFVIMFNTMIPLSLYVSMEIIKVIQIWLLNDIDMYDPKTDTPFKAQTSNINEELGQVSYIFSDKTGTLTDNEMKFRKISVAGTAWLHDFDLEKQTKPATHKTRCKGKTPKRTSISFRRSSTLDPAMGLDGEDRDGVAEESEVPQWKSSARPAKSQRELRTKDMMRYIQHRPYANFSRKATMFLLSIALCHTCLPEVQEDGSTDFQAASPDELALVRAAQELGFLVVDRNLGTITIRQRTGSESSEELEETYEVLDVIEFSSKRKRMSVVVRFPSKKICIITKGADSIIMQRLRLAGLASSKAAEIEERANRRKSMEAQMAMRRKSSVQIDRAGSISRPSISLNRPSITLSRPSISQIRGSISMGRPSMSRGQRLQPVRDELDSWLQERENEVDMSIVTDLDNEQFYTPRPSMAANRMSIASSGPRSSMGLWEDDEEWVDDALANDEPAVIERCLQHINDFATEGLRTLLYGYRFVSEDEYAGWKKIYLEASTSLSERERKIEQAGELIEVDLDLAGATAIEDKLQEGVPQTIDKLRRANIKMWMLTGDKRETAINIGHSCRLIKDYSIVTIIDWETGEVEQTIGAALLSINSGSVAHSVVVIDGQTLAMISELPALERLFMDLAVLTDSVICCRASPSQKAKLVKAIRHRVKDSVTLAIGDGANDIAMIQTAHVGIGITGKEGLQAARTSDYAIAQFRFLSKLLLVHGRYNYIRTCKYVLGTFWKEMLFYLTQAIYQRWNGYTGTSLYESWSLSMFNTLFTSLPVIFMGAFEKDLQPATLLAVPELYAKGQRDGGFNLFIYLGWMTMASAEAVIVFFSMWRLWGRAAFEGDVGLFPMGQLTFSACVILISVKMQLIEMHNKSPLILISLLASIGGWFLWNILLSLIYNRRSKIYRVKHGFLSGFGTAPSWWFSLSLIVAAIILLEVAVAAVRSAFWTQDADLFQELERDESVRRRFEDACELELGSGWEQAEEEGGAAAAGGRWVQQRAKSEPWCDDADPDAAEARLGLPVRNPASWLAGFKHVGPAARQRRRREEEARSRDGSSEQERREEEVAEILRRRPGALEPSGVHAGEKGNAGDKADAGSKSGGQERSVNADQKPAARSTEQVLDELERRSCEVSEMLRSRFGSPTGS